MSIDTLYESGWRSADVNICRPSGAAHLPPSVEAWIHPEIAGLAVTRNWSVENGEPNPDWSITHLGTGCRVRPIGMPLPLAKRVAAELAGIGDWTRDHMSIWADEAFVNAVSDLMEYVEDIHDDEIQWYQNTPGNSARTAPDFKPTPTVLPV